MTFVIYPPGKMFENSNGVAVPTSLHVSPTASSSNATIISAVSGQCIVVLGGTMCSSGAASYVWFRDAGSTYRRFYFIPANTVATPNVEIVGYPWGAFVLPVGVGLSADIGAVRPDISLTYYTYAP